MKKIKINLLLGLGIGALIATSAPYESFYFEDTFSYTEKIVLTEEHRTQYVMIDLDCFTRWDKFSIIFGGVHPDSDLKDLLISRHNSNILLDVGPDLQNERFSAELIFRESQMGQQIYTLHWQGTGSIEIDYIQVFVESKEIDFSAEPEHPFLNMESFSYMEQQFCLGRILTCNCTLEEGGDITMLEDCDGDGAPYTEDCDECDPDAENYDCDGDGYSAESDCFDFFPSAEINHDCDNDGDSPPFDCDDFNYQIDTNGDCDEDGVETYEDCDDQNPALPLDNDLDCDGVLSDDDCDDQNPYVGSSEDCDGDGIIYTEDCDDSIQTGFYLGSILEDEDCDGFITENDCDDQDPLVTEYLTYTGDLLLSSQEEIEAWRCLQSLTGALHIEGETISSIAPLNSLESITDSLVIRDNPSLEDVFDGSTLQYVGTSVTVENNPLLCQSMVTGLTQALQSNNESLIVDTCCNNEDC